MFYYDLAISSKAILGCPPVDGNPAHAMDKANDGDWLTFFFSEEANGTVTFDLQNPTWIRKILFVPRNDDNFITPGNSYELFYQDGALLVTLSVIYLEFKAHLTSMATTAFCSDTPSHLVCA